MNFGVPKEIDPYEFRVGLVPPAVDALVRAGHNVYIETSAGLHAGFHDGDFEKVGGKIVYSASEAYRRADLVIKISPPRETEYMNIRPETAIIAYLMLPVAPGELLNTFEENEITAIGAETIQEEDGSLPIVIPASAIAGGLAPIIAGQLMQNVAGGKGILLNGLPGTPPADIVILGAGSLGTYAARAFSNLGAQVTILDNKITALQKIDEMFGGKIGTMISNPYNVMKAICFADVVVCAAAITSQRAPQLISKSTVQMMNPRSIIMDFSIDKGGCAETSHPTTILDPTFVKEGIIHYCVPNTPTLVARTASYGRSNALLPFLLEIGRFGLDDAIHSNSALKAGVNMYKGKLSHSGVAAALSKKVEVSL